MSRHFGQKRSILMMTRLEMRLCSNRSSNLDWFIGL